MRKFNITFTEAFELYAEESKELPKTVSKCSSMYGGKMPFYPPRFCGWA